MPFAKSDPRAVLLVHGFIHKGLTLQYGIVFISNIFLFSIFFFF